MQQLFSLIFKLAKPLILLTQTGLPNKSLQETPIGRLHRVRERQMRRS
jgi:hypothetical protein